MPVYAAFSLVAENSSFTPCSATVYICGLSHRELRLLGSKDNRFLTFRTAWILPLRLIAGESMMQVLSTTQASVERVYASSVWVVKVSSSHKYTPQGVKLLYSATTGKTAEAGISRTFYANVC